VLSLSVAPDGQHFAAAAGNDVRVWQIDHPGGPDHVLPQGALVRSVAFSPEGGSIAAGGGDHAIRLWDVASWQMSLPPLLASAPITALAFAPTGRHLAAAAGNRAHIFDVRYGESVSGALWFNDAVRAMQWAPDADALLVAAADGTARLWQPARWPGEEALSPPAMPPGSNLALLAEFLSGRRIDADNHPIPVPRSDWTALSARVAREFPQALAPLDVGAWHRRRAQKLEQEEDWFAAMFHWNRLLAGNGSDAIALARHRTASQNFAAAEVARRTRTVERVPARTTNAPPQLIDLTAFYNAGLTETWLPTNIITAPNDLAELPRGVVRLQGIEFDVRGLIQLSSSTAENQGARFPREITGIPIGRPSREFTFLHGTVWKELPRTIIGGYRVHYANGEVDDFTIQYADDVVEWWESSTRLQDTGRATTAWRGSNPATRGLGLGVRLYLRKWRSKHPNVTAVSVDFYSTTTKSSPFLVAIRAD
jgi:hypothetical protein